MCRTEVCGLPLICSVWALTIVVYYQHWLFTAKPRQKSERGEKILFCALSTRNQGNLYRNTIHSLKPILWQVSWRPRGPWSWSRGKFLVSGTRGSRNLWPVRNPQRTRGNIFTLINRMPIVFLFLLVIKFCYLYRKNLINVQRTWYFWYTIPLCCFLCVDLPACFLQLEYNVCKLIQHVDT